MATLMMVKPQAFKKPRFTREIAAIPFDTASLRFNDMKRYEVRRNPSKPKKWRKTVARSSPNGKRRAVRIRRVRYGSCIGSSNVLELGTNRESAPFLFVHAAGALGPLDSMGYSFSVCRRLVHLGNGHRSKSAFQFHIALLLMGSSLSD